LLGLACIAASGLALPAAAAAAPQVSVFDSLATIRPDKPLPSGASSAATISAAGNEFESFQVAVDASSGAVSGLDASISDFSGSAGTIPAADVTLYREAAINITQPSDNEGGTGRYNDALIPEVDPLYHENRNAFPYDIAAGARATIWVDVFVPDGQAAGSYSATLTLKDAGGQIASVPVNLTVDGFSLPSTSSLKSAFHVDPWSICSAFTGDSSCNGNMTEWWTLMNLFQRTALDDRITLSNAFAGDWSQAPSTGAQAQNFATYMAPLVQGTDTTGLRLKGAKMTSLDAYWHCANSAGCLAGWKSLASQYNFSDRFFLYNCDEPGNTPSNWANCATTAAKADAAWPGVTKLVTANQTDLANVGGTAAKAYTDIVTPVVNDIANRQTGTDQSPLYSSFLNPANNAPGTAANQLWMYTSCMSYSCNESEVSYNPSPWSGIPGYAIDEPASEQRAMGMISYAYGAGGELYYQTTEKLQSAWSDQYYSGGNGDGTLFYPGNPTGPNGIGGTHPIPLDSIRMKRIRDGRDDYEYLHLLDTQGQGAAARSIVTGLFGSLDSAAYSTGVSAAAMEAARTQLAGMITGTTPPPPPAAPNTTIKAPHHIRRHKASLRLSSDTPAASFQCKVDRGSWKPCRSRTVVRHLSLGRHSVRARAMLSAAGADPTPAHSWIRVLGKRKH